MAVTFVPPFTDEEASALEARLEVLIDSQQIAQRVQQLARELQESMAGERVVAVAAMSGGFMFLADLVRHIIPSPVVDFVHVGSYGDDAQPASPVMLLKPFDKALENRHVIVVEDIIDTGRTARFLLDLVRAQRPAALSFVTLLDKPSRRRVHVEADYVGFTIPDRFVVGYGLDYAGYFRSLPHVCALPE